MLTSPNAGTESSRFPHNFGEKAYGISMEGKIVSMTAMIAEHVIGGPYMFHDSDAVCFLANTCVGCTIENPFFKE
jgi:hypothetical protein